MRRDCDQDVQRRPLGLGRTQVSSEDPEFEVFLERVRFLLENAEYLDIALVDGETSYMNFFLKAQNPFAILTASCANHEPMKARRFGSLFYDLKSFGIAGIPLKGYHYATPLSDPSIELACFVPSRGQDRSHFYDNILKLLDKSGQEFVVYSNGVECGLLYSNGKLEEQFQSVILTADNVKTAISKLTAKVISRVECAYYAGSVMGRVGWDHSGLIPGVPFSPSQLRKAMELKRRSCRMNDS